MTCDIKKLDEADCKLWLSHFREHYAPSVVNGGIQILRSIFQEAVAVGARFSNPAKDPISGCTETVKARVRRFVSSGVPVAKHQLSVSFVSFRGCP